MNLGELIVKLGVDDTRLLKAEGRMKAFENKVQNFARKATTRVTIPIIAAGGAMIKYASDMTENVNKVDVAFGKNAKEVRQWGNSTLKTFGVAKVEALNMVALYGDMSTSMGLSTATASKMSTELVGLAADMASFKNIRIDVAKTALAGVFTGETESLKRLGIVMTQANLQQYALSQGITTNIKDMSQAQKVNLRYNYVLSVTKNAQGDFARTSGSAANQMRLMTESLKELAANFGSLIIPAFTSIITKVNKLIQFIGSLDDSWKKVIITSGLVLAAIGPLSYALLSLIKAMRIILALMAGIDLPVTLVVAGLAAISAGAIYLWKNWEAVKERISDWSWWRKVLVNMLDKLVWFVAQIADYFNSLLNVILKPFGIAMPSAVKAIEPFRQKIMGMVGDTKEYEHEFGSFGAAIKSAMVDAGNAIGLFASNANSQISSVLDKANKLVALGNKMDKVIAMRQFALDPGTSPTPIGISQNTVSDIANSAIKSMGSNQDVGQQMPKLLEYMQKAIDKAKSLQQAGFDVGKAWKAQISSVAGALASMTSTIGAVFVDMKNGLQSFVQAALQGIQQVINLLLAQAIAAAIAGEAHKGLFALITASIAVGGLLALFNKSKSKVTNMKEGGVIPPGYPNDTFRANLSSGEAVIPLQKYNVFNSLQNKNKNREKVIFQIDGDVLTAILDKQSTLNNAY